MQHVRLEYAENIISRNVHGIWQEMSYMVRVDNLSYHKDVAIHWCGEDGEWHVKEAHYR